MNHYQLPDLPYDFSALEPVISGAIMEIHYTKHHQTYVNALNAALEKYAQAEQKNDLETMIALQGQIRFNGGGHINHSLFWSFLAPEKKGGGGEPSGALKQAIEEEFTSFAAFVESFNAATAAIQGSGWGWLGYHAEKKRLQIATCANQDPLSSVKLVPLLGVDVWEHAYYLQYKNARAEYLKNIWKVVNWSNIEARFDQCKK